MNNIYDLIKTGEGYTIEFKERFSSKWSELSKREIGILILMLINSSAIQKQIDKLKQKGLIKRIGADRGGHWEVLE